MYSTPIFQAAKILVAFYALGIIGHISNPPHVLSTAKTINHRVVATFIVILSSPPSLSLFQDLLYQPMVLS
jgi:hypothetical protein